MDDRKWILGYDDSKGSGCLCGLQEMSRKLNGRRKHCGINVTIVPTWTAVMKGERGVKAVWNGSVWLPGVSERED